MIFNKTKLINIDNSGAYLVELIRVLKKKKDNGVVGDIIVVAVKKSSTKKKVKRHDVKWAIIVQTKKYIHRKYLGIRIKFDRNATVLIDKKYAPLGNRIKGTVTQELRNKKFMKIILLAPSVL